MPSQLKICLMLSNLKAMVNPFTLSGKRIIITGASSGIGQAIAIECSRMGAQLIITGRNSERLKITFSQLEGSGHEIVLADIAKEEEIDRLVESIPNVDGLVNNAGLNIMGLVPFIKEESLSYMMQTNLKSPVLITSKIIKKKKMNKGGSIVFTSSISGQYVSSLGNSVYSATKGGLTSFMKNAALELASKKIRCNAVLPGMVETPLKEAKDAITQEEWEANRQLYPLKRFGSPNDIAYATIFLLSDASSWITGTELIIDGGRSLI